MARQRKDLLDGIAEFFGVPGSYLFGGPLPERLESELKLVIAMKAARVRNVAARNLGDVAPEALDAIAEALRNLDSIKPSEDYKYMADRVVAGLHAKADAVPPLPPH